MVDSDEQNLKKKVLSPNIFGKVGRLAHFVGRFGAVLALTVGVLFLPTPEGLSAEGHRALADALLDEIAANANVPMIEVARGAG